MQGTCFYLIYSLSVQQKAPFCHAEARLADLPNLQPTGLSAPIPPAQSASLPSNERILVNCVSRMCIFNLAVHLTLSAFHTTPPLHC